MQCTVHFAQTKSVSPIHKRAGRLMFYVVDEFAKSKAVRLLLVGVKGALLQNGQG